MVGSGQVQEPHKGCLGRFGTPVLVGRGAAKINRYSEVRASSLGDYQSWPSAREEFRRSPGQGFRSDDPRGAKPKGGAGGCRLKMPCGRQAVLAGVDLETEARRAGLPLRAAEIPLSQRYAGFSRLKGRGSLRDRKPPKGESHERRRCETKPARDSREQAVQRVTKP
jgi:hypothetical protein